ncbi:NUDIX domain-containing protein [Streptomyces sp. WAC06614]|uniref:NUDIX domain-containing protein n=1 Tax=Streptomyces sp. WAC06614 TaxID=2487416 RepID=UPI000F779D10|nr:NUDIX domain-containing protein [Streptomyces sp. WAC06614]RSS79291.1 NUDIX domain-containing protein [Streptomyces sp. WAC06614]
MDGASSNVVISNSRGQFLMHLRDFKPGICNPGRWGLVGGAAEPEEDPERTARRELLEETGLSGLPLAHLGSYVSEDGPVSAFHAVWDGDAESLPVPEGIMFRWFAPEQLALLHLADYAHRCLRLHDPALRLTDPAAVVPAGRWTPWEVTGELAAFFDAKAAHLPAESRWHLQVLKIGEEFGEAAQALIGVTGTNPRKGRSHTWDDVTAEVCDVIVTAMVTLHRLGVPDPAGVFAAHLERTAARTLAAGQG